MQLEILELRKQNPDVERVFQYADCELEALRLMVITLSRNLKIAEDRVEVLEYIQKEEIEHLKNKYSRDEHLGNE